MSFKLTEVFSLKEQWSKKLYNWQEFKSRHKQEADGLLKFIMSIDPHVKSLEQAEEEYWLNERGRIKVLAKDLLMYYEDGDEKDIDSAIFYHAKIRQWEQLDDMDPQDAEHIKDMLRV